MLKKRLTSAPSKEIEAFYKKEGDQWVLQLEDDAGESDKLKEFRDSNIKYRQQLEAQGAELTKIKETLEKLSPKEEKKDKEPETLTGKVEHLTKMIEQERQARINAEKRARISVWERSFVEAASKAKVRDDNAAKVLLAMAKQTFREDEKTGDFLAFDEKGLPRYSPNSTAPYSVTDFLEEQKSGDYKDLFAQPQGGGGRGSGNSFLGGAAKKTVSQADAGNHIDEIAKGEAAVDVKR